MTDKTAELLEQYKEVATHENLRMFLSSMHLLKKSNAGWGELQFDVKSGEITDARIKLTLKREKEDTPKKVN